MVHHARCMPQKSEPKSGPPKRSRSYIYLVVRFHGDPKGRHRSANQCGMRHPCVEGQHYQSRNSGDEVLLVSVVGDEANAVVRLRQQRKQQANRQGEEGGGKGNMPGTRTALQAQPL
jgi:hypothetical protein